MTVCQRHLIPVRKFCALDYDIEHCRDRDATQKAKLSNRLQWHKVLAVYSPRITQARPALPRLAQHYPGSLSITQARPALPKLAQHYLGSPSITQARSALPRLAQHYPGSPSITHAKFSAKSVFHRIPCQVRIYTHRLENVERQHSICM
ncbi:hypothetical protein BC938DRAFT_473704 [Jimgerdemannia flammicorona]|uniref:Uncharacterized protein n=1 Tax=Jimgerdemannia flammicorona TaxID=994334 RepID=A0A433Q3H2_9FUNG|nr:hypothetical protein BC938DRAFT_473704 [Jimgerdemannia flammicorona]